MAGILDGVDQRTQLAGHNRFELLLFKLVGPQRFGINVFKVQEVIQSIANPDSPITFRNLWCSSFARQNHSCVGFINVHQNACLASG